MKNDQNMPSQLRNIMVLNRLEFKIQNELHRTFKTETFEIIRHQKVKLARALLREG